MHLSQNLQLLKPLDPQRDGNGHELQWQWCAGCQLCSADLCSCLLSILQVTQPLTQATVLAPSDPYPHLLIGYVKAVQCPGFPPEIFMQTGKVYTTLAALLQRPQLTQII